MWNDLNMRDRHKFIKLAVTNGVYDLDTIHSLYDNNEYKDGGNMRIAPYKDNASYPDRKLYRNVKRDFRKNPEAEYKDYDEYGVRVYNPSLSSNAHNRKERQEAMLERIRQDFPEIQKNDVKKTAFKSNSIGWGNSIVDEDNRTLYGLQQEYDFVSNIVPYGKLGMDTPENIRRKEELERKNRNTTFDYTNNFAIGGDLHTGPNRVSIDTNPIIDRIRAERLARYTAPDSALAQIKELTDNIRENEFKREFAEWINPTRNTNDYVDIRRTIPVEEARPTFINTYKKGGDKKPKYNYDWNAAQQSTPTTTKPTGHYNVTATSNGSSYTIPQNVNNNNNEVERDVTYDRSWYKDPFPNMVTEKPIEPLYGFKDPVFMAALGAGALANGAFSGLMTSKPLLTAVSANAMKDRIMEEGLGGIYNHPILTAMDLGMLSPVAKGIKTVGNEAMWKYTPGFRTGIEMSRNVRNAKLNPNVELPAVTRFKLGDVEINNPEMFYRQGDGNLAQDLLNSGIIRTKDTGNKVVVSGINLSKPTQRDAMFNKGKVAFNSESNMGKYLVTTTNGDKMVYTQPKTWTGNDVYVNNWRENPITLQESSAYVFDPNYGYVKLPTTEMPSYTILNNYRNIRPTINNDILGQEIKWRNMDNPLKGASNDGDFYREMMKYSANGYILGEPYYYSIFGKPQLTKGLSKEYQENLLNNTIGRTINYLKEEEGLDEIGAKNIYDIAKQQLKDVQIGRFSKANYELAGQKSFAGFYNPRNNFISVRTDIPEKQTILHEGRHMLDYNMPITLPKKHKEILNEAYGEDFINIPKTKYAGGLKDYSNMDREMVTTNLDARNKLLGNLDDLSIEQQNSIIDKAGDNVIISAVEDSNGYGRRYINYLRDNGLLTKEKIQKFRNAMKYVGSFSLPTGLYLGTRNNE